MRARYAGSVFQRKDRKDRSWVAAISLPPEKGRRRRITRYATSRNEAERLLMTMQGQLTPVTETEALAAVLKKAAPETDCVHKHCPSLAILVMGNMALCAQHMAPLLIDLYQVMDVGKMLGEQARAIGTERSESVYFAARDDYIKIGKTTNVEQRLHALTRGGVLLPPGMVPGPLELIATVEGGSQIERSLHRRFAHLHVIGEWFRDSPEIRSHARSLAATNATQALAQGRK